MSDPVVLGAVGALPRLNETLPPPNGAGKTKTNVGKAKILALGLFGLIILLVSLMLIGGKKSNAKQPEVKRTTPAAYSVKNNELDSETVAARKDRIRKEEEEKKAREAREQQAARERKELEQQLAAAAAAATGTGTQTTNAPTGDTPQVEDPNARKLRSSVLLASSGSSPVGSVRPVGNGDVQPYGGNTTVIYENSDPDWQRAETDRRMRAAGINPDGDTSSSGSAGFGGGGGGLGARLQTSAHLKATSAGQLGNLDFLLKKGTQIPCALVTGIDTQLPGYVTCRVVNDVYSANAKTLLVERGATFFGEQASALQRGQTRAFVVWARGDNPSGVTFNIDSPGVDSLGYSGIPGIVNRHLLERFGSAILVSIIDDLAKAASQRIADQKERGLVIGDSSTREMSNMADKTLDESINIPTTLTVKPGTVIYINVARDVYFDGVYGLLK